MQSNLTIGLAYTFRDKYRKSVDNSIHPPLSTGSGSTGDKGENRDAL